MSLSKPENINMLWAHLIVEELIRCGADYFCIAPGSRCSPLSVAVADNKKAKTIIHFDERGVGFHALGYTSAANKPAVIITTSGTAVANLFPAIIEASKKKIPLIILTADRPPELRCAGAHQTIDQVKIFGEYVRWQFDMPTPTKEIPPQFILTTIDQAVHRSSTGLRGPVHLNCMYREPLAPVKDSTFKNNVPGEWMNSSNPYTQYISPKSSLDNESIKNIAAQIKKIRNGILVIGKLSGPKEGKAVVELARKLNWPVFVDASSQLRLGSKEKNIIYYFDQILSNKGIFKKLSFDGVIHLGGRITSKRLNDLINTQKVLEYIMVLNHPLRNDPFHKVTTRIQCAPAQFCKSMMNDVPQRKAHAQLQLLCSLNNKTHEIFEKSLTQSRIITEAGIARLISQHIPKGNALFLANSLSIRYIDRYADHQGQCVPVGANRGASGIDGTIATSIGFSCGLQKKVTLLAGDLAFLHDLNSLSMIKELSKPLIAVVLNNNGGAIFSQLPIAHTIDQKQFKKFFTAPHNLTFEGISQMFGMNYDCPKNPDDFLLAYNRALKSNESTIIEIRTDV